MCRRVGTSKEIQNDLLLDMPDICHEQVIEEMSSSPFLVINSGWNYRCCYRLSIKTYLMMSQLGLLNSERYDAKTLSNTILALIDPLVHNSPNIAQSYDGAAMMSGQHADVQAPCLLHTLLCLPVKSDYI
nr:unnamed protein product [Callosobruchus analis]